MERECLAVGLENRQPIGAYWNDTLPRAQVDPGDFVVVNAFMAWCIIKFRYDKNRRADYEPENKRLEWILTIFTAVGVAAMLAPGLAVWADFVTVPEEAAVNGFVHTTCLPARAAAVTPRRKIPRWNRIWSMTPKKLPSI